MPKFKQLKLIYRSVFYNLYCAVRFRWDFKHFPLISSKSQVKSLTEVQAQCFVYNR